MLRCTHCDLLIIGRVLKGGIGEVERAVDVEFRAGMIVAGISARNAVDLAPCATSTGFPIALRRISQVVKEKGHGRVIHAPGCVCSCNGRTDRRA